MPQRPGGLPVLTSQSAWRLSITTSRWVSSSHRSRKSSSSSGLSSPLPIRYNASLSSTSTCSVEFNASDRRESQTPAR
jgi:hypothetical protein